MVGTLQVLRVLDDTSGIEEGSLVAWKVRFATNEMGTTTEQILYRLPSFLAYLKNRAHENELYQKKLADNLFHTYVRTYNV